MVSIDIQFVHGQMLLPNVLDFSAPGHTHLAHWDVDVIAQEVSC